jgi:phytoene dehydrogenase-like protein
MGERWDAIVVGSGPNGLVAALRLAENGRSVLVLEGEAEPGGGLRTEELLEPGFRHDVCASVMALAPLSPALAPLGLDLVLPDSPLAHPFDDGSAVILRRSVQETARLLGADAVSYRRLVEPLVEQAVALFAEVLSPAIHLPHHPFVLARFGLPGLLSHTALSRIAFRGRDARALLAGAAAHGMMPLNEPLTAAFSLLMLVSAHARGWPFAAGGSASVAADLRRRIELLGGEFRCGQRVIDVDRLPSARSLLLDLSPKGVLRVAGHRLGAGYRWWLRRYRYGPGVFKIDWTLDGPIPWTAKGVAAAGTVHLGGASEEIVRSEYEVGQGRHAARPFVLLTQPSLFDNSRAPAGKHVAWAYCHVPNGSNVDMTAAIENQVERFAPGFRDLVRARGTLTTAALEQREPNCVGGDVNDGRQSLWQLIARPALRWNPYSTPDPSLFICSAATPPGGGVHGMCGWHAADSALHRMNAYGDSASRLAASV